MLKTRCTMISIAVGVVLYDASIVLFSWSFKLITDSLTMNDFDGFKEAILFSIAITIVQVLSLLFYIKMKNIYVKMSLIQLKEKFLTAVFDYDVSEFKKNSISHYQSFLYNDMSLYEQQIIIGKIDLIEKVILLGFATASIAFLNYKFLLLIALIAGMTFFVPSAFGHHAKKHNETVSITTHEAMDKTSELLNGFIVVKSMLAEKMAIGEGKENIIRMESAKKKYRDIMAIFQSAMVFLGTIITLLVFVWGGHFVISNHLSVGELIALIQLLFHVIGPIMGVMTTISAIRAAGPIRNKYEAYIKNIRRKHEKSFSLKKSIKIKHVSFLADEKYILKNISLNIEKGKKYAIIGENGSGKSTLLKIIAREIVPEEYEGEVMIDDMNIYEINDHSFWKHVSYMTQTCYLFHKSIKDNVLIGVNNGKHKEYEAMCRAFGVNCLAEDARVPDDMDENLSGGEKQIITFIREMIKDSDLMLVDEPDAALDQESADTLRSILLQSRKTCIMVTHRITSALKDFDRVIIMENGELKRCGKYSELVDEGYLPGG